MQKEPRNDNAEMRVQDAHEPVETDTTFLASELTRVVDLSRLTREFDEGLTPLRDVGQMRAVQREILLNARQAGSIDTMFQNHAVIFEDPVHRLHDRIVKGDQDQPIGHNFLVNATMFIDAQYPWALDLDAAILARTGRNIRDHIAHGDFQSKDKLLTDITENPGPEMIKVMAVYLAGRSLIGEQYLRENYGEILERTKGDVFALIQQIAVSTGLRTDMIERVAAQIHRTTFGSFDHLAGLVTSQDTGAMGDYRIGSLRIEVQFEGSVRSPGLRTEADALGVIAHELVHASSAQYESRCGLQMHRQGMQANEGMTEYLAQLATRSPGILTAPSGSSRVSHDVPYSVSVLAILSLHKQYLAGTNRHFEALFNAYHGDIRDQSKLESALDAFYTLHGDIRQM